MLVLRFQRHETNLYREQDCAVKLLHESEAIRAAKCIRKNTYPFADVTVRSSRVFRSSLHGYWCAIALGRFQRPVASLPNYRNRLVARNIAQTERLASKRTTDCNVGAMNYTTAAGWRALRLSTACTRLRIRSTPRNAWLDRTTSSQMIKFVSCRM
jgi:hypothetical protein